MEKNSEPSKTFTHKVKRFLTKVVRSCNGGKTVFPKAVLGELDIHLPSNEAQFSSITQSCPTLCDQWAAAGQTFLFINNSQSLLKLMSIELMMPSNHLILCRPLLLLPSIFPSVRIFSNESALRIRWPKYWSFNISPSNEHSGLISFRMDWLDLPAVQGTLKKSFPTPQFKSINSLALSFL